MKEQNEDLPIFVKWMDFLEWLLSKTEKIPKKARFTFANRIDNLALDIVEDLVEARYTKNRKVILKRSNLKLEKLSILLRFIYKQKYINLKAYEYGVKQIYETGCMLGGWIKDSEKTR